MQRKKAGFIRSSRIFLEFPLLFPAWCFGALGFFSLFSMPPTIHQRSGGANARTKKNWLNLLYHRKPGKKIDVGGFNRKMVMAAVIVPSPPC